MNLPNKLTVFRVILIVPFVLVMLGSYAEWPWYMALFGGIAGYADYIALGIFIIASLTDLLDGRIARKYNLVTNFGKFMDPLADKLLVCAALICLVEMDRIPAWIVIIIMSREFIISGFRLVAADNRVVIAANYWGKFKTTFQMVMVCLMIANIDALAVLTQLVMWIAVLLTVISLIDYMVKNKNVLFDGKI
ncbi:MAG: CDP-diacylglycerol--glycerol-3-phosphate 3-phosphatidyltransferase [Lachnospiraceae bacterium]|nr:CDP-diacylglycerol--glycerol-3-phosphate 3-phosphatidyltransferase [Lachnospiraceae bacterium]